MQIIVVKIEKYDRVCHWCGKPLITKAIAIIHQGMIGGGNQPLYCSENHAKKDAGIKSVSAKELS